ncbi:hypothetical protein ACJVC5_02745 [Peredibacter sp. HCB2-198]|uniref:hypothetical protein n=1 Tax=Peredibacter sp. HCB2-198 TaxID=3383025 RepID=UPI0038B53B61
MKMFIGLMLFASFNSFAASSFWNKGEVQLDPRISHYQGLDMAEFNENFSETTSELRDNYIRQAINLMENGALGMEAMEMVLQFDDRVYDRRQVAKAGMGETLVNYVRSGLELLNEEYEIQGGVRRIDWSVASSRYDLQLIWGVRPGAGVYTVLKVTNRDTGISRSFASRGSVLNLNVVGYALASQVFNSVHKTTFPLQVKIGSENLIFSGIKTFKTNGNVQYRYMLQQVGEYCRSRGERLPTVRELTALFGRGAYFGGMNIGLKTEWAATDYSGYSVVSNMWPMGNNGVLVNLPYNYTMTYTCVKAVK